MLISGNSKSKLLLASIILSTSTTIPTIPNISAGLYNKPKYLFSELPYVCSGIGITSRAPITKITPTSTATSSTLHHPALLNRFHGSLAEHTAGKDISNIHHLQPNQKTKAAGPFY